MKTSRFNLFATSFSISRAAYLLALAVNFAMPSAQAVEKVWGGVGSTTTTVTFNSASNWDGGVSPSGSITGDTVAFGTTGNIAPELNTATRSVLGFTFNSGANAFTFGSTIVGGDVLSIGASGIANSATGTQTFGSAITVVVGASHTWNTVAGGTLQIDGIVDLSNSSTTRNLIIAGAGTTNVSNTIRNSFANTNTLTVTSTGTTTLSGNNAYSGLTTMNAVGGTLNLSGNNSAAIGGVTLTAGTLNVKNANALGTGAVSLASSSALDNTSGAAITNLGNNPVTWGTNSTTAVIFGTGASTSSSNLDLGTGTVTASSSRLLTLAGTGTTLSMGTLNVTSTAASGRTFTFDGAGNTAVLRGFNIAPSSPNAVTAVLAGSANLTIAGPIVNGSAFANGVEITRAGLTIFSGTNTYTGLTKLSSGTLQIDGPAALASASTLNSGGSASDTSTLNLAAASAGYAMDSLSIGGIMRFTGPVSGSATLTFAGSGTQGFTGAAAEKRINVASAVNVVVNGSPFNLLGAATTVNRDHTIQVDGSMTFNSVIESTGAAFTAGFSKTGTGVLSLNSANTYNGTTFAEAGILRLGNSSAIPGGIAATGGTSALVLSGGAIIGLTPASGDFTRNISAAAFDFDDLTLSVPALPVSDVGWVPGETGGFAAFGGDRSVNFGGAGASVGWSSGNGRFGGGLILGHSTSDSSITVVNPISIGDTNARTITVNDGTKTVDAILSGTITGGAGSSLVKDGAGILALNAANTYIGETNVIAGVLALNGTSIVDTNKVTINGGKVDLTGTETVGSLYFGAVQQVSGTWGASGSGATNIDNTRFSGAGVLNVVSVVLDPYASWIDSPAYNSPPLSTGDKLPSADPDNDGINNLLEFTLGGNPVVSSQAIQPTQATVGSNLVLSYKRTDESESPATTQVGQWSTDLNSWTDVTPVLVNENGTASDDMTVSVPTSSAVAGHLFVRLKVVK
ncbi:MAG: hypothetical protein RLZZ214_1139 [Verrucomicrobiota bacterium]|jgi:autotransporter-associated beta strand protein